MTVTTNGAIPNAAFTIAAGGTFVFDPQAGANSDSLTAGLEGDSPIFVEQESGQSPQGVAPVPEPGTLALLLAAAALWSAVGTVYHGRPPLLSAVERHLKLRI